MVKLTAEEQEIFVAIDPAGLRPVPGGWGRQGATHVALATARRRVVADALSAAWRRVAVGPRPRNPRRPRVSRTEARRKRDSPP